MKDIEEASRLTIELAKLLIQEMQAMEAPWQKAFLRCEIVDGEQTTKGSYVAGNAVRLFDVLEHKPLMKLLLSSARRLQTQKKGSA